MNLDDKHNGKYDTLLCNQVLEHIYETDKFVSKCNNVLKKGGYGIFTMPMTWKLHAEPYDYHRFTKYSLEIMFKEKGFEIVELKQLEGGLATISQLIILFMHDLRTNNVLYRIFRKAAVCFLNIIAPAFDKVLYVDNICLTYLLVVKKYS